MNNNLNIALTGAGNLGAQHARAAQAYGARIVAVHDTNLAAAQKLAAELGDGNAAPRATDKLEELFVEKLDGFIIATPPPVRLEPITLACRAGVHLFIEKPPAYDVATGRACLEEIERAQVMAAVGFNFRYEPRYEKLRELIAGETVHLIRTVCAIDYYLNFSMSPWFLQKPISGGPLAEQAIHWLDCARYLLGNVQATRAIAVGHKNMALDKTIFDAENAMQMTYELAGGVLGVHTNHCGHERFQGDVEIIGPHLRLRANLQEPNICGYLHGEEINIAVPPGNSLGLGRLEAWLRAIETKDKSLIRAPFSDALSTLSLVEAGVKSQQTNQFENVEQI